MDRYEIKFYDNSTLLITNSDKTKGNLLTECKRLMTLTKEEIHEELGCNSDIVVTHFVLVDNKKKERLKEHIFE